MGKRIIIRGANFATNAIDDSTLPVTYYSVAYNLSHCVASTNVASVAANSTYIVTITPQEGYTISSISVLHNGLPLLPIGSSYTYKVNAVSGNISITALAVADAYYTSKLIQGFWIPIGSTNTTGRLLNSVELGDTADIIYRFVGTTKDGYHTAFGFSDGEITTTIPANCHYRVVMSKKNDGSVNTGNVESDLIRTNTQTTSKEIKVCTNTIPELLGLSASSYPYWAINIEKSDGSDSTVADMIALGVRVESTDTNVKIEQGYWSNHIIDKTASTSANFVCASCNGGLIPFSAGEYQITIPKGRYRVVLSSTVNGATGTMCRTSQILVSSGVITISSNDLLSIMTANADAASSGVGMDAFDSNTTYLAWSVHYGKSTTSTSTATSPLYAVNEGLSIIKV